MKTKILNFKLAFVILVISCPQVLAEPKLILTSFDCNQALTSQFRFKLSKIPMVEMNDNLKQAMRFYEKFHIARENNQPTLSLNFQENFTLFDEVTNQYNKNISDLKSAYRKMKEQHLLII